MHDPESMYSGYDWSSTGCYSIGTSSIPLRATIIERENPGQWTFLLESRLHTANQDEHLLIELGILRFCGTFRRRHLSSMLYWPEEPDYVLEAWLVCDISKETKVS